MVKFFLAMFGGISVIVGLLGIVGTVIGIVVEARHPRGGGVFLALGFYMSLASTWIGTFLLGFAKLIEIMEQVARNTQPGSNGHQV